MVNQAPHQIDLLQWCYGRGGRDHGVWKNLNHPTLRWSIRRWLCIKFKTAARATSWCPQPESGVVWQARQYFRQLEPVVGVQTDGGAKAMFVAGMSSITEAPLQRSLDRGWEEENMLRSGREARFLFNSVDS